jgi:hypothetical protein
MSRTKSVKLSSGFVGAVDRCGSVLAVVNLWFVYRSQNSLARGFGVKWPDYGSCERLWLVIEHDIALRRGLMGYSPCDDP